MNLMTAMLRAGIAMAWESRFSILGKVSGRVVKTHVAPHLKLYKGSPFATVRALNRLKPVWKRAVHAPHESIQELPTLGRPETVKYVIQRHFAHRAGEHLDLRLMIKGRGISFAIPKARMPQGKENLLAVLQPDHIEEYFSFEGEIPEGQMGAGEVLIAASGEADVLTCTPDKIVFELPDGPMAGRYVLINTSTGVDQNWLFREFPPVVEQAIKPNVRLLSRDDGYLEKAARAADDGLVLEEKVDGACAGWRVDKEGRVELAGPRISRRTGLPIRYTHKLPAVVRDLARADLRRVSGEGELWHKRGPNHVAAVLNSNPDRARFLQRKHGPIRLKLFNLDEDKPYKERYNDLRKIARSSGPSVTVVHQIRPKTPEVAKAFAFICRTTDDGIPRDGFVAKDLGLPGTDWWKGKPVDSIDTEILGFKEGTNGLTGTLGSLKVNGPDGRPVNVGSGFTRAQRDWIWGHRDLLEGDVVKVAFHERGNYLTNTGPRFDGFHESKSEAGLQMYAEALADGTDKTGDEMKYALKSAAGWRRG